MQQTPGHALTINMSLRLFIKEGVDPVQIAALLDQHFGKGEAIVGGGVETALAGHLQRAVIADLLASDVHAGAIIADALLEVDLWRNEQHQAVAVDITPIE